MDDALKLKIAASLDLPTDAAADPEVARALDEDADARAYARDLHTIDRALRTWPARARTDAEWERFASRLDAKLEDAARERAKVRKGKKVSSAEPDPAAVPVFEDGSTQAPESKLVMSEPQENDADLENLAALTRTSTVPSGVSVGSVRPSISDAVDDTSSGIVDIKKLAEMARAEAEKPAPKADAKPEPEAEKPAPRTEPKADAKPASKNNDVMVTPSRAATPALDDAPPRKGGSTLWGAVGGMALMAGAFALYTNMQSGSQNETTGGAAPATTEAPAQPTASAPAPQSAPPVAMPAAAQPTAPPPPQPESVAAPSTVVAAADPAPTPAAAPPSAVHAPAEARTDMAAAQPAAEPAPAPTAAPATVARRAAVVAPARPQAAATGAAATGVTAEREAPAHTAPPPPAAPAAPAAQPAARPTAAAAAPGARSVDDLMARVAGGGAPAPTAPAAETAAAELPERPTRSQITSVLSGLNGAVRSCTNGQTGTAPVSLVIANDGTVSSANVSGQFGNSAAGECISGVVRRAHFPRFRAQQVTLTYPFVILPPR